MKKLKMKIVGFDKESHSLIVSFCNNNSKYYDPEKYPSYAFQPLEMWPDIRDLNEIKKRIAIAGVSLAEQQEIKEKIKDNPINEKILSEMVGEEGEYIIDELLK